MDAPVFVSALVYWCTLVKLYTVAHKEGRQFIGSSLEKIIHFNYSEVSQSPVHAAAAWNISRKTWAFVATYV